MDFVKYFIPIFILLLFVEATLCAFLGREYYRLNDTINSLSTGVIRTGNKLFFLNVGAIIFTAIEATTPIPTWDAQSSFFIWVAAFFLYDLCFYWFHRVSHEYRFFWAAHVVHHQSEEFNYSTALRQTSTGFLTNWVFYIPLFLIGVPVELFVTVKSLNLVYQFWVHTRLFPKYEILEYVFVTPSNHRVHHAKNTVYINKNYGGVFIIWDRIFGTYKGELLEVPPVYGVTKPLNSWNPIWANISLYLEMIKESRLKPWGAKLSPVFERLEYHNSELTKKVECFNERYDPACSSMMKKYVLVNFFVAILIFLSAIVVFLLGSTATALLIYFLAVYCLCSIGWLMEGRGRTNEIFRLVIVAGLLLYVFV